MQRTAAARGFASAISLLLLAAPSDAQNPPSLHAGQIDATNISSFRVGGPDAIGGLGDWAIGNGTLCAVVSDPSHEAILSEFGGILVDLAHCGRNDDQFVALHSLMNMSRDAVLPVRDIRAELDEAAGEARIVTSSMMYGVEVETIYRLRRDRPHILDVHTQMRRKSEGERLFLFGDVALHGNRQLSGFSLASRRLKNSRGFLHTPLDPFQPIELLNAVVPADSQVLVGGDAITPGISYGIQLATTRLEPAEGEAETLPTLAVNGSDFSMLGVFAQPFWVGGEDDLGIVPLSQTLLMDLDIGDKLLIHRELFVGKRADVASVTDQIWASAARVEGSVSNPAARLHVRTSDGVPVTEVRPEADGSFSFRIPPGNYRIKAVAPGPLSTLRDFSVKQQDMALGELALPAPALVELPQGQIMRLVFIGADGTKDPSFGNDLLGFRIGSKAIPVGARANHVSLAGIASDPRSVQLAPGRYEVFATRGIEHTVTRTRFEIAAGNTHVLEIDLPQRALRTPHWISADLHVHSAWSDDSALPQDMRVASFVAQGGEVMVATEHDNVIDYAPRIRSLGLSKHVVSVIGAEVTGTSHSQAAPRTIGHVNAFPLPHQPDEYRGGVPRGEGVRLRDLVHEVRELGGSRVVQLNHPRRADDDDGDGVFFEHLSFGEALDPGLPLNTAPNHSLVERHPQHGLRDLDFDAIELINGPSMVRYRKTRADWFSFLLQGEVRTGTANSDSHRAGEIVALPINYVKVNNDRVTSFKEKTFVEAVRTGRSYGSTGPILSLRLVGEGSAGIGETYYGNRASLHLSVRAADWVSVSETRIYVNGELVYRGALEAGEKQELPLEFSGDSFITAEVEGVPGEVYRAVAPEYVPFAFTNPIFIDANEDLKWTPPGLPDPLPLTISAPNPPVDEP